MPTPLNPFWASVGVSFVINIAIAFTLALATGKSCWFDSRWLTLIGFAIGIPIVISYNRNAVKRAEKLHKLMDEASNSGFTKDSLSKLDEHYDEIDKANKSGKVIKWIVIAFAIAIGILMSVAIIREAGL